MSFLYVYGAARTLHAESGSLLCADMPEEAALKIEAASQERLGDMTQGLCLNTAVCLTADAFLPRCALPLCACRTLGAVLLWSPGLFSARDVFDNTFLKVSLSPARRAVFMPVSH